MNRNVKLTAIPACVLVPAFTASWSARAGTIFLSCNEGDIGIKTFIIDLTSQTVNNEPAQISQTAIDLEKRLQGPQGVYGVRHDDFDRAAGTVTEWVVYYNIPGENGPKSSGLSTYSCTAGSPAPTKF